MSLYGRQLRSGHSKIAVWGLGYIGYSSAAHFGRAGIQVLGTDVDERRVDDVNIPGKAILLGLREWLGFDTRTLIERSMLQATACWQSLLCESVTAHLVAVPTERDGLPWMEPLADVLSKVFGYVSESKNDNPPLVIVESTVTASGLSSTLAKLCGKFDIELGEDVLFGVAPRRDWFLTPDKSVRTIPRIVGGTDSRTTQIIAEVIGLISETVVPASDHIHACIVKAVENTYRHVNISLANQLSLAYPSLDMVEVLRLAGTKWNMETYHPSIGIGGYCVPLGPRYVLEGAERPDELPMLRESLHFEQEQPRRVACAIVRRGCRSVGILGLAYGADIKVHTLSPTLRLAEALRNLGVAVKVHDPLYTPAEIAAICDSDTFSFPDALCEFDSVVVSVAHSLYRATPYKQLIEAMARCRFVLDNAGVWTDVPFSNDQIEYHRTGDARWLGVSHDLDSATRPRDDVGQAS